MQEAATRCFSRSQINLKKKKKKNISSGEDKKKLILEVVSLGNLITKVSCDDDGGDGTKRGYREEGECFLCAGPCSKDGGHESDAIATLR